MADETEHRTRQPTEEELAAAERELLATREARELMREQAEAQARRPRGAARLAGYRAAQPGPPLIHDPYERQPDDPNNPVLREVAAPVVSAKAPLRRAVSGDWRKIVADIGKVFVHIAEQQGSGAARREMRDEVMLACPKLCTDLGDVIQLWRFALDIDKDVSAKIEAARNGGPSGSELRKLLTEPD